MGKTANIKFNGGIIHTPSDVSPVDGDLNECINLVPSDGELKPIEMPVKTEITPVWSNEILAAVHNNNNSKFYIFVVYNTAASYIHIKDENNVTVFTHSIVREEIKWVETVGSTLVFGTDKNTHYALFREGQYLWLGDVLPRPVFDVRIKANSSDDYFNHTVTDPITTGVEYPDSGGIEGEYMKLVLTHDIKNDYPIGDAYVEFENNAGDKAGRYLMSNFNSKLAKLLMDIKNNGRFVYPFFVRYALKLYDGSYISHSSPILMLPSTDVNPILAIIVTEGLHQHGTSICGNGNLHLKAQGLPLSYKFMGFYDENNSIINDLSSWADIIKGVGLFLSSEIPTYDVEWHNSTESIPSKFYTHDVAETTDNLKLYGFQYYNNSKLDLYRKYFVNGSSGVYVNMAAEIPVIYGGYDLGNAFVNHLFPIKSYNTDNIKKKIEETSVFYKAKEYSIEELINWGNDYKCYHDEVEYGYLSSLETKQILKDDYISRSRKTSLAHYAYNQRLFLGGLNVEAPLWYVVTEKDDDSLVYSLSMEACFEIVKPDKKIYINCTEQLLSMYGFGHFIYYPDVNCQKVIVKLSYYDRLQETTTVTYAEIPMEQHNGLNGAYAIMPGLESLYEYLVDKPYSSQQIPQQSTDKYYKLSNNLIISKVSNPFVFDIEKSMEIGDGTIMALNVVSVPMSSDKYGGNNIIVFTDQGIFAPAIDDEGAFSGNVPPVSSADTIMNIPPIGQPNVISDGQVLYFITKRGLMEMRGLQVRCVSEVLNGKTWDYRDYSNCIAAVSDNTQYNNIVSLIGSGITDRTTFNQTINNGDAFLAFDYKHNRILVTETTRKSHWFYSIKDRKWGKLVFNDSAVDDGRKIVAAVFNWNESYVQAHDGNVWDLMGAADENDDVYFKYGFIASRPIRLGSDDHKSIHRLLHRVQFNSRSSMAKIRLYGSVDGIRFYEITSLRGASYKYFVVLLYTCMKANERYSYMSVEFEERFRNKLR